ncbi:MAG: hypothetical protein A2V67_10930 [Deltaproteobacteria bacterium RBG_13_61_14]|nr:MAG: hypothetical protein A2V67_10930 [Deltaproteobacteria bacterium RBG_13_61_14]
MIRIEGLIKDYRVGFTREPKRALSGLDFQLDPGESVALLGPNGAGKTTILRILFSLIEATAGTLMVFGMPHDEHEWRKRAGFLSEFFKPPVFYTGRGFLRLIGRLQGMADNLLEARIQELAETLGLTDVLAHRIGRYSRGMMQKIGLAQALVNDPDLLVLDEPTANLDAVARKRLRDYLAARKERGKSLLISSHVLSEVEGLTDRVVFLLDGKIREQTSMRDLLHPTEKYEIHFRLPPGTKADGWPGPDSVLHPPSHPGEPEQMEVEGEAAKDQAVQKIVALGGQILQVSRKQRSLEQQFLEWVGAARP